MGPTRGPEFFRPVGEVGTTASESPNSTQTESGEASNASPDSAAAQKLWADIQGFLHQLKPLAKSYVNYLRAYVTLNAFLVQEKTRLVAARFFLWCCAVLMLFSCWIFFSMFLWRAAISLTGQDAMGPLVLVITHGAVAYALWIGQNKLRL